MISDTRSQLLLTACHDSTSRRYAVFDDRLTTVTRVSFVTLGEKIACHIEEKSETRELDVTISKLSEASSQLGTILRDAGVVNDSQQITHIGLRVTAPSAYFMRDRLIDDEYIAALERTRHLAPHHVALALEEIESLRTHYPDTTLVGISDSAFHATKPNYTWNYGINIHDADKYDIKRFGYHGIAVAASIDALWNAGKLPPKVIVCHLGSESSVTGVFHGRSIDTTTGFSPHEGLMSATSSGTLDVVAADALKTQLSLDDAQFEDYLGTKSGLSGLADEPSIEKLFEREADGNHMAHLGLTTYIHTIHKAIGSMIVAMNGCDLLVFSGEIGEHSAALRKRITAHLQCMDFTLDGELNDGTTEPTKPVFINQQAKSRPIVVIPTDEARYMASHIQKIL